MSAPTCRRRPRPALIGCVVRAAGAATAVWLVLTLTPTTPTGTATPIGIAAVDIAADAATSLTVDCDTGPSQARPSAVRDGAAPTAHARTAHARTAHAPTAHDLIVHVPVALGGRIVHARASAVVLAQAASMDQVLTNIRNLILGVAGGAALVCWSVAGLRMMFSQGDPGEVAKARAAFRAGAVGFAVVILAPLALAVLRTVVGL